MKIVNYTVKILIIDDEAAICRGVSKIISSIEGYSFDISTAYDGFEGLEKVKDKKPDIIIIDIVMPGLNGLDFIKKITENGYDGKIYILTGFDTFSFIKTALKYKVDDYLLKPIDKNELVQNIINAAEELLVNHVSDENEAIEISGYSKLNKKLSECSYTLKKVLSFIDKHYMEGITLQNLAEKFSLNEKYICSIFSKELGITFLCYYDFIRLKRAIWFLLHTAKTIEEITMITGFGNSRQFYSIFKKRIGVTPGEFRGSHV